MSLERQQSALGDVGLHLRNISEARNSEMMALKGELAVVKAAILLAGVCMYSNLASTFLT